MPLATGNVEFKDVAVAGERFSSKLEQGQAQTPLKDHFSKLGDMADSAAFSLTLLGLDLEARNAVLSWLCGQEFQVFAMKVPNQLGLLQVDLQEQGYVLETDSGRKEFDRLDPFIEALQSADVIRDHDPETPISPVSLRMSAPKGVQGLQLLMPDNLRVLLDSPQIISSLVSKSNFLVLAASAGTQISAEEKQGLIDLLDPMDTVLPIVVGKIEPGMAGWWRDPKIMSPRNCLLPVFMSDGVLPELPDLFLKPDHPLRQGLFRKRLCQLADESVSMTEMRYEQEAKQLKSRRRNAERQQENDASSGGNSDNTVEELRELVQSSLATLRDDNERELKRAFLPSDSRVAKVKNLVEGLTAECLEQDYEGSVIRLSIDEDILREVNTSCESLIQESLHYRQRHIDSELSKLTTSLSPRLERLQSGAGHMEAPPFPDSLLKELLEFRETIAIKYKGEMPRRNFFQRISQGRRSMYSILMLISIFGGMFGINRSYPAVTILMALLFFGGFIFSFISFRSEDRRRLDKEMDRVRDTLANELKRALNSLQREITNNLNRYLNDTEKALRKRIDQVASIAQDSQKRQVDEQRDTLRKKMQHIDHQEKQMNGLQRDLLGLRETTNRLVARISDEFTKILRDYQTSV